MTKKMEVGNKKMEIKYEGKIEVGYEKMEFGGWR